MYPLTEHWVSELNPLLYACYARAGACHDLNHAVRVSTLAERISSDEGAPTLPVVLAALLHDCGHAAARRTGKDDHELRSATIARSILAERAESAMIDEVVDAIEGRRFAKLNESRTVTGAILDDADNLDAIGFSGIARVFLWAGEHGRDADAMNMASAGVRELVESDLDILRRHWNEKLSTLPQHMRTATGKRLAAHRASFMQRFVRDMGHEIDDLLRHPGLIPGSSPGRPTSEEEDANARRIQP